MALVGEAAACGDRRGPLATRQHLACPQQSHLRQPRVRRRTICRPECPGELESIRRARRLRQRVSADIIRQPIQQMLACPARHDR
jgi:hypothetical protein